MKEPHPALANGDFRLSGTSPLLAAGVILPVNASDLDNHVHATSGRIDLGAYQKPSLSTASTRSRFDGVNRDGMDDCPVG